MRPAFLIPQCLQPENLFSGFPPRMMQFRVLLMANLSCQIGEASIHLVQKSDNVRPLSQKESVGF